MSGTAQASARKHMYLITEHEDPDRVGGVSIMDSRLSRPLKNQEGPVTILDHDIEDFREVGKQVGLGYHDFDSETAYQDTDHCSDVMKQKLAEIDEHWLKKAGLDPAEILPDGAEADQ